MKIKSLLLAGIVVFIMASCTAQKTCPAYALDVPVIETPESDSES